MQTAEFSRGSLCSAAAGLVLAAAMAGSGHSAEQQGNVVTGTAEPQTKVTIRTGTPPKSVVVGDDVSLFDREDVLSFDTIDLAGTRRTIKYWLGVQISPVRGVLAAQLDLPQGKGLVVEQVMPNSPAAKAGIRQYDVLLSLGGTPLAEVEDLTKALGKVGAAETALELVRRGKKETVRLTPVDRIKESKARVIMQKKGDTITVQKAPYQVIVTEPWAALAVKQAEFPKDLKVVITKQGPAPAEIVASRGDETWKATEETLGQLPDEIRKPVQQFLRRPDLVSGGLRRAPLQTLEQLSKYMAFYTRPSAPQESSPPATAGSVERRLEEITRRLEAIEKTLKDKR